MSSKKGPKYIYYLPKNINSVTIIITLEGIEEINTEKMTTNTLKNIFFSSAVRKL